jgi:hypothetical protein
VRHPHPGVVLAELRQQVVGDQSHGACQDAQHNAEEGLRGKGQTLIMNPRGWKRRLGREGQGGEAGEGTPECYTCHGPSDPS